MIKLYQFSPTWGLPNLSHFAVKVETYLRMADLPYEVVPTYPFTGPKGKLPYIEDNGRKIADSRFILDYLKATYGDTLDGHLSAEERAMLNAFQRMIEESFYWVTMATRWQGSEANWQENKKAIFGSLPPIICDVAAFVYRHFIIKRQIYGQGTGRLTKEEITHIGKVDLNAMSDFLAGKSYFLGERPSSLDATAYGFLANTIACPIESPVKEYALAKENLVAYCQRMKKQFFPELAN